MRAKAKRAMVMETGTKDPALFRGSIVLQSFVVHLERRRVMGKKVREHTPHLVYHAAVTIHFSIFMDLSALDIFNAASTGPSDRLFLALHLAV